MKNKEIFKIYKEVFDLSTERALWRLSNLGYIDEIVRPISTGKEANVFLGKDFEENDLAVKIYRIETSNFQNMWLYIKGDDRFSNVRMKRRDIVFAWAKKEYKNLLLAKKAEINAPEPIISHKNILIMEFIGKDGEPAKRAKDLPPNDPKDWYKKVLKMVKDLYQKAGLIHGDISEYNILNFEEEPYFIDFGQGVLSTHPEAINLLKRDIKNINRWFKKLGVETKEEDEILKEIIKDGREREED